VRRACPEAGQPSHVLQPDVGYLKLRVRLDTAKEQRSEIHPFEVLQPGVGHLGVIQVQCLELGQSFEMTQPRVGSPSAS
jgi:hypothetical protein